MEISAVNDNVSIVILTKNEQDNIKECIESCKWCGNIYVVDSFSDDLTESVAVSLGVCVYKNKFESFGKQRNWSIDNIPTKTNWIFHLDADERFTPELILEISNLIDSDPEEAAFFVANKLIFMNRWLRFSSGFPVYQVRLFHKERCRFRDHGHGQQEETTGKIGYLKNPYLHYNFSKGIHDWIHKHNNYSSLEASINDSDINTLKIFSIIFSKNATSSRRFIKALSRRFPASPLLKFLYLYFIKLGFLDGKAGLHYAILQSIYEYMILIKSYESKYS